MGPKVACKSKGVRHMGLIDFIKKQFVDVIEWVESTDGVLAWRYPFDDREIQNGATLVVRESQTALFVNEGKVADVFGPGTHKLTTQTLPLLTNLKNWDKLFDSPFKSDVYFSARANSWICAGEPHSPLPCATRTLVPCVCAPLATMSCAWSIRASFIWKSPARGQNYTVADLDGQLRGVLLQHLSDAVAQSGIPFP